MSATRPPGSAPTGSAVDVLRAGGPVGHDLLAVDWGATPLGPPESWPQSLTTVVQAMLGSKFAMWMAWGPELTFFCNEAYRRDTLAAKYPWALGRPTREVWAEIWPEIGPRIDTVIRDGEATWDESLLLFLERSGYREETYHTFSYSPLTDESGNVVGMLCVVSEDTDRVVGERRMALIRALGSGLTGVNGEAEVLDALEQALGASDRSMPFSLIYLFDEDGVARLARRVGVPAGHAAAPHAIDPADAHPAWPAGDAAAGARTELHDLDERFDALPTGAWDEPPAGALVVPLAHQSGGHPYGFLVAALNRYRPIDDDYRAFIDLAARQISAGIASARAYEAERERAEQLAALDAAKTAFFTNVSHELRTPLTLLLGPAEDALADRRRELAPEDRQRFEVIDRNAQRLLKLVNTLLDFSRLESGRAVPCLEPVDLSRYTAELVSMFESAVQRAGLTLTIDCPPLPGPVAVDREMWAKIVLNLVSNALKHTFEGGITVTVRPGEGTAELAVQDTGIGIAPAEQARLFERFHRVSGARSRSHEGSGIGLALVAELAGLHGGTASVHSAVGAGSRFTVTVPVGAEQLLADAAPAAAAPSSAEREAEEFVAEALRWLESDERAQGARPAPAQAGDGRRVLVVDDNADMRGYVAEVLAGDYVVETAADGAEALERARARTPDLVLTDVMMPRLDGFGLLSALRADPDTMHVPVVMLSARGGDEAPVEGLEAGADDYLVKPFTARELLARVHANLELDRVRRTRDELARSRELLDQAEQLAQIGSWEIDLATNAIRASAEYYRLLGIDHGALEDGGVDAALGYVHPDDVALVQSSIAELAQHGAPMDFEFRVRPARGEERLVRARGRRACDEDGRPAFVRGSLQDVTEQRRAEQALAQAAAEREAAAREHRIADELQRSLLPPVSYALDRIDVATYYRAGAEGARVGGDWYDVIELSPDRTALVVGDVMGRGVRAAALMGQLRAAIRAYAQLDLAPAEVLAHLDQVVGGLGTDQIVTSVYAVYDATDRSLTFANAGHLPPAASTPGGAAHLVDHHGGPPLGTGTGTWPEHRITLAPGALLALYTDGLVERRDRDLASRIELLCERLTAGAATLDELPRRLVEELVPEGPDDDVAVLVARVP
ncbi:MAG TPA: SpoIIE family protein phosphatase [Baekduia sp.]|nr:SpoIIE family protein phosphatase [Baekduia sp.]